MRRRKHRHGDDGACIGERHHEEDRRGHTRHREQRIVHKNTVSSVEYQDPDEVVSHCVDGNRNGQYLHNMAAAVPSAGSPDRCDRVA